MVTGEIGGILRYFEWDHLPPRLQEVSRPFGELANRMVEMLPTVVVPGAYETLAGLRRLLEAKDCAVRAALE